nr:NADH dehydrogenase subunit 2 [Saphanus piceus]
MWKIYKILFFNTLLFSSFMAISSYSWFSMWISLEINLLSMIPLMSSTKNLYPTESTLKYFIAQTLASIILLFSIILSLNLIEFLPQNSNFFLMIIMNSAFLTKMGAAPFHAWFPEVMEGLNWLSCLILMTWQKVAPMILLMLNCQTILFLACIIIMSSIVGSILGLNQISLRKILAYSSINHISWMIASLLNFSSIWLIYFVIYTIITTSIVLILHKLNIFYLKQFIMTLNFNKNLKFFFCMNFLSLGGLPPFLGFFPKWLVINHLIYNNFYTLSLILILFSLITLFFYLRVMFSTLTISSNEILIYQKKKFSFLMFFFNFLSLVGLLESALIFSIF